MPSFNKVLFIGHITRDIELRELPGGGNVANFSLAMNHSYKDKSGERQEDVCYIDCEAFNKTGEVMNEWLGKGSPVLVEGRLRHNIWETDGQKRSKHVVVVDRFEFMGSKSSDTDDSPTSDSASATKAGSKASKPALEQSDIPF